MDFHFPNSVVTVLLPSVCRSKAQGKAEHGSKQLQPESRVSDWGGVGSLWHARTEDGDTTSKAASMPAALGAQHKCTTVQA